MDTEIALVVKAPNQQTEDVRIRAVMSWSIAQLKERLAEVYPTKPRFEEQRIIYSGRLLTDSVVLRDVLRTYEGQDVHTVHLVCAPRRPSPPLAQPPSQESEDGLRRRNASTTPAAVQRADAPRPEMRQNDQNHTAEMNYYAYMMSHYGRQANTANFNYPTTPEQMVMMQNAYMQYMQQYANIWRQAGVELPQAAPAADAQPAPAQAPDAPPQDEAAAPRDWLDWLYVSSRFAILFSLLYFYSSPLRLAVVMVLAVAGYLYQLGFFREAAEVVPQVNRAPEPARAAHAAQQVPNVAQQVPNVAQQVPNPAPRAADAAPRTPENTEAAPAAHENNVLGATWMIFTSFFTSLIPDTPNVV